MKPGKSNQPEGTVIIESTGNLQILKQRLEKLISRPLSPGPQTEIWVVCKEKVRPRVEPFLRHYYRTVPLLVLPNEPDEIIGSYLLNKVRSENVAFMPEGSAFCFPSHS